MNKKDIAVISEILEDYKKTAKYYRETSNHDEAAIMQEKIETIREILIRSGNIIDNIFQ